MDEDSIIENKAFLFGCGRNADGELGMGSNQAKEFSIPKNIEQLRDFPVRQIAISNTHAVLMTPKGELHVTGSTLHGKMGLEGVQSKALSKFHMLTQLQGEKATQVCCSDYVTLVLLENGQVV